LTKRKRHDSSAVREREKEKNLCRVKKGLRVGSDWATDDRREKKRTLGGPLIWRMSLVRGPWFLTRKGVTVRM